MSIQFLTKNTDETLCESLIEPFRFPAGEWHLRLPEKNVEPKSIAVIYGTDVNDLVVLGLWADAMKQRGERTTAYIPYFPAARADRGEPFGAKVYANIVNSFELDEVVIFDPHSPVIVSLLNNVRVVDSATVIREAIGADLENYVGVIAPDKGAVERAQRMADAMNVPLFKATKERDFATGKLLKFAVETLPSKGRLLIVDDICEGGGTFLGLAEVSGVPKERLSLWVSHGSFSGKANLLTERFSRIYTTDSLPGAHRADVGARVTPIMPFLMN